MKSRLLTVLLLFHICLAPALAEEGEAPFGLTWGMSTAQLKGMGVELQQQADGTFGQSFSATKLPKAIADQEVTFLSFGKDDKLWRIAAVSTSFENDPYGGNAKQRYSELMSALGDKYGSGHSVHQLGKFLYSEPNHFVAGIRDGETSWFTNFDKPNVWVQLGLTASDHSTLRWRILYENKTLKKAFEQDQRTREKGSL